MKFPSVKKAFGRAGRAERISRKTVKFIGAALVSAGLMAASAPASRADIGQPEITSARPGAVFVIPAAPAIGLSDGTTTTVAQHVSHSSHVSHGSHCSSYSYC